MSENCRSREAKMKGRMAVLEDAEIWQWHEVNVLQPKLMCELPNGRRDEGHQRWSAVQQQQKPADVSSGRQQQTPADVSSGSGISSSSSRK